jgi:hypothetical protein
MLKIVESSSLHATRLTAVKNSQLYSILPVAISHSFIVLSAAPVTKNRVCAEPESAFLSSSLCFVPARNSGQLGMSAKRYVQSQATVQTLPLCPLNVPNLSPFDVYQTLTTWSLEAEKRRSPSALKMIWVRDRSCPCRMIGFYREDASARSLSHISAPT